MCLLILVVKVIVFSIFRFIGVNAEIHIFTGVLLHSVLLLPS